MISKGIGSVVKEHTKALVGGLDPKTTLTRNFGR